MDKPMPCRLVEIARKRRLARLLITSALFGLIAGPAGAQVTTSITSDNLAGTAVARSGAVTTITGGTQAGGNLFHSFATFSLASGATARWVPGGGTGGAVANIINRVTGGAASNISGTLDSTAFPAAAFWFINPAGIVFGAGARVAVPNAAYFSTASMLRFADGASFSATAPGGSTFTVANPQSFGFLGNEGNIGASGLTSNFAPAGTALHLSATNIAIGTSSFGAGQLDLFAVGPAAIALSVDQPLTGATFRGALDIDARITTAPSGAAGGGMRIGAGALTLSSGVLQANAAGTRDGGGITIDAGAILLRGAILTASQSAGNAGGLSVTADSLDLRRGGALRSLADAAGNAGAVNIGVANALTMRPNSVIASQSSTSATTGAAGAVTIRAGTLTMENFDSSIADFNQSRALISASSQSLGAAGNVTIAVRGAMTVGERALITASAGEGGRAADAGNISVSADSLSVRGGQILSATSAGGDGGDLDIQVANALLVDGGASGAAIATRSTTAGSGRAGSLRVAAGSITVSNGGAITSTTASAHSGGAMDILSRGATLVSGGGVIGGSTSGSGNAADLTLRTGSLSALRGGQIQSTTTGSGDAGVVRVTADSVDVRGGGSILSSTFGTGDAGNLTLSVTGDLTIGANGSIAARSRAPTAAVPVVGAAGSISIDAGTLTMEDFDPAIANLDQSRAVISASTQSQGAGGNVSITVRGAMRMGNKSLVTAGANSFSQGANAGSVRVTADSLALTGGHITSSTAASGDGGNVSVQVANALTVDGGVDAGDISTSSTTATSGRAGVVQIDAGSLSVRNGGAIASSTASAKAAGTVGIQTRGDMTVSSRGTISSATSGGGQAGGVTIRTGDLRVSGTGQIGSSTTGTGHAGTVNVTANSLDIRGGGSSVLSYTFGPGNAGNVNVAVANGLTIGPNASIAARSRAPSQAVPVIGAAGSVTVSAGTLTMEDFDPRIANFDQSRAVISASTQSQGAGGNVTVNVRGALTMGNRSLITASANEFSRGANAGSVVVNADSAAVYGGHITSVTAASGNGGNVALNIANGLVVDGGVDAGDISTSSISATSGNAGSVRIATGTLVVRNGGSIASSTSSARAAGTVDVSARGAAMVAAGTISSSTSGAGRAGDVAIASDTLAVQGGGSIQSSTGGTGDAGIVSATVAGGLIVDGGDISTSSTRATSGSAGSIRLTAASLAVRNGGTITASTASSRAAGSVDVATSGEIVVDGGELTSSTSGAGQAGGVTLRADALSVRNGGSVASSSSGRGNAGSVTATVANMLTVDGGTIATISQTAGAGIAGDIGIVAGSADIVNRGSITTNAVDQPAGNIALRVASPKTVLRIADGGAVSSNSGSGAAGNIMLDLPADGLLILAGKTDPGVITTTSGPGTGGRITITDPLAIISNGGDILALGEQAGANVQIQSRFFIRSFDRTNLLSVNGLLSVDSIQNDLSSAANVSDVAFLDASKVLNGQCSSVRSQGAVSLLNARAIGPLVAPQAGATGTTGGGARTRLLLLPGCG